MPAANPLRQLLTDVGRAICLELVRLLDERGPHGPLRRNSALRQQLLSDSAVQVEQQRGAGGQFGSLGLTILAQDYLQWLDTGRPPGARKVPIQALLQFIRNRGLGQARGQGGRFTGTGAQSLNSLAFAIQTSIFKNGRKGLHIINLAWLTGSEVLDRMLDDNALDEIEKDLGDTIKMKWV